MNYWEAEFTLGEIFCESFIIGVLRVSFYILSSNGTIVSAEERRVGTVILANAKQHIRQENVKESMGLEIDNLKMRTYFCRL